ncbi:MAG: PAS domain S-box protein [Bacillota bacterium]
MNNIHLLLIWSSEEEMSTIMSLLNNTHFNIYTHSTSNVDNIERLLTDSKWDNIIINASDDTTDLESIAARIRMYDSILPCTVIISDYMEESVWELLLKYNCSYVFRHEKSQLIHRILMDKNNKNRSTSHYKAYFKNANEIMFVTDSYGNITDVNDATLRIYGYEYSELVSKNINAIRLQSIPVLEQIRKADMHGHSLKEVHCKKDGSCFPVEISTQPILSDGKKIFLSVVHDISEKQKIEEDLKEVNLKYQSLIMNTRNGFAFVRVVMDERNKPADYIVAEANNAFESITGYRLSENMGRSMTEVYSDNQKELLDFMKAYGELAINGGSKSTDSIYSHATGRWFTAYVFSTIKGYLAAVINDITDIKKAEEEMKAAKEEAERANRAKSDFLSSMSHEIRSPMNGLLGMLELTLATRLDEAQKENLFIAKSCATALLAVVNDILDISKIEAGKMIVDNSVFNIYELMKSIARVHRAIAKSKGLDFILEMGEGIPAYVEGDFSKLQQILYNLIGNAIKFTEKGYVKLGLCMESENEKELQLRFAVTDTGIGIKDDEKELLFNKFSQVGENAEKRVNSTGLGLSISKKLTEMLGGSIWVQSQPDAGSTFFFTISVSKAGNKELKKNSDSNGKKTESNYGYRIMMVEDDKINQMVTRLMLEKLGHRVDIAENGEKAIKLYNETDYDMILMDIQMPVMDGIQATREIRQIEKNSSKHVPIIAFTAHAFKNEKEKFLAEGMDGFIAKPIIIEELLNVIDEVMKKLNKTDVIHKYSDREQPDDIKNIIDDIGTALTNNDIHTADKILSTLKEKSAINSVESYRKAVLRLILSVRRKDLAAAFKYRDILVKLLQENQV